MTESPEPIIDELFEDKILACLYRVIDFSSAAAQHLKPSYFSNPIRHNMAKMAIDFQLKYNTLITGTAFVHELKTLVDKKIIKNEETHLYSEKYKALMKTDIRDYKYILEKLIIFIKHKETRLLIEDSVKKYLPKNNFDAIEKGMARVAAITIHAETKPYDHFSTNAIDERIERREREIKEKRIGISTGIPAMDKTLVKGGWYRKEMYILMAPPKRGKTMALLWFANFAVWQGFNVSFFSLETSQEVLSDRTDAMNSMVETKALTMHRTHVAKVLKAKKPKGKFMIFEYPTKTCTVAEVERQVEKLAIEQGIRTDMLVVDYGDIMKPITQYKDKMQEQATIFEDLRALSGKFNIPLLTATQINRVGTGKAINTGIDVAGTYEKIMVADSVISLSATNDELKEGKMRIHFSESRNNEKKTLLIETKYNFGTFYGDFVEEEL